MKYLSNRFQEVYFTRTNRKKASPSFNTKGKDTKKEEFSVS